MIYEGDEIIRNYVYCPKCECVELYNYNGTTPLLRHYDLHIEIKQRRRINSLLDDSIRKLKKKFGQKLCESVKNAATEYIVTDAKPFEAVSGKGLIKLLLLFTQIGQSVGKLSEEEIKFLLPHPTSVSFKFNEVCLNYEFV